MVVQATTRVALSQEALVMLGTISLSSADKAVEAGRAKAAELGIAFTIAIVDAAANLVTVSRMDGAALASVESSQSKARTSVMFGAATRDLAPAIAPGAPMFGIDSAFSQPLAFVGGGVPVVDAAGTLVGAIGVGGGTPDHDHEVAGAVKSALV
jgi:uncharacterized protein GlcG (DUF336 family)